MLLYFKVGLTASLCLRNLELLRLATYLYILDCLMYVKINLYDFITNSSVHIHFTRKITFS